MCAWQSVAPGGMKKDTAGRCAASVRSAAAAAAAAPSNISRLVSMLTRSLSRQRVAHTVEDAQAAGPGHADDGVGIARGAREAQQRVAALNQAFENGGEHVVERR